MSETAGQRCPECGSPLSRVEGLCPACVAKSMASLLGGGSAPELESPLPGYQLGELLGRGAMGQVFHARRNLDGTQVAVKIALTATEQTPALAERLAREAAALAALEHPNVLRVLESGTLPDGRFFLVTELAAGGNLALRLQGGPLPPEVAARCFREIVSAVVATHQAGILHRDLKPANVLLDEAGNVQLADFSLARLLEPNGQPAGSLTGGDVFGTPYYLAPEARLGVAGTDERADIFSLGVLLHEMLTGRVPIGQYVPASRVAGVPVAVDALIGRCLAEDPARRPANAAALLADFEAALKSRPKRRKFLVATLILAFAGAVFALFPARRASAPPIATAKTDDLPIRATRTHPWVNSLGMRFVPVPASNLLFSVWETRRQDFEPFAAQASARVSGQDARWRHVAGNPGSSHPVSCVDLPAAREFCSWLTTKERAARIIGTNDSYRLPTDGEWGLAAALPEEPGQTPEDRETNMRDRRAYYPWGRASLPPESGIPANFAGTETTDPVSRPEARFHDPWPFTAPVGSFPANEFGLHDLSGNVAEWCDSAWNRSSDERVLRGGSWDQSSPAALNLATRQHVLPVALLPGAGFRVVLQITPP